MKTVSKRIALASIILSAGCAVWACASQVNAGSFTVPSPSMEPTLPFQSRVAVEKDYYAAPAQVKRGDIVLYHSPRFPQQPPLVKRVVGLPGDRIRLSGTSIWVNDRELPHVLVHQSDQALVFREADGATSYSVKYQSHAAPSSRRSMTSTVPSGTFFVLGDNRDNSDDSRYIGTIPFGAIAGRVRP